MLTDLVQILDEQGIQVERSRNIRQQLALEMCRCRSCVPGDVYTCDDCERFRPACLLDVKNDRVVCLGGCRER